MARSTAHSQGVVHSTHLRIIGAVNNCSNPLFFSIVLLLSWPITNHLRINGTSTAAHISIHNSFFHATLNHCHTVDGHSNRGAYPQSILNVALPPTPLQQPKGSLEPHLIHR